MSALVNRSEIIDTRRENERDFILEKKLCQRLALAKLSRLDHLSFICLRSVDSTQDYLMEKVSNQQEGTIVLSEIQTAGKGRKGRKWFSAPGGLWLSIALRPPVETLSELALLTAKSTVETFERGFGFFGCTIKAPNDILYNGGKIGGILVDSEIKGKHCKAYVGIGLNLNNSIATIEEISRIATSYFDETGKTILIEDFTSSWLPIFDLRYNELCNSIGSRGKASSKTYVWEEERRSVNKVHFSANS